MLLERIDGGFSATGVTVKNKLDTNGTNIYD